MEDVSMSPEVSTVVNDIDEVTKSISFAVPSSLISERVEKKLNKLAGSARLKGFRPGKAPRKVIDKIYGHDALVETAKDLMTKNLTKAIVDLGLRAVGEPEVTLGNLALGEDFTFAATVSLWPQPSISGYDDLSVSVPESLVDEGEVEKTINSLVSSRGSLVEVVERTIVAEADVVEAKITTRLLDEGRDLGTEPITVKLGDQHLPPEVEAAMLGCEVGETVEATGIFSAVTAVKQLAGKRAHIQAELLKIHKWVVPEATDAIAKDIAAAIKLQNASIPEIETLEELRSWLRDDIAKRKDNEQKGAVNAEILKVLCERNQFKIPQAMLDREIRGLLVQFRALDPRVHDMDTIDVSVYRERLNPIADERARATIVADRLAEQFNIEVTKEEIDSALLELSVQEKVSVAEVAQYMEQNDMLPGLTRNLQRDKVLEMLREKTAVTLVAPGSEAAAIAGV